MSLWFFYNRYNQNIFKFYLQSLSRSAHTRGAACHKLIREAACGTPTLGAAFGAAHRIMRGGPSPIRAAVRSLWRARTPRHTPTHPRGSLWRVPTHPRCGLSYGEYRHTRGAACHTSAGQPANTRTGGQVPLPWAIFQSCAAISSTVAPERVLLVQQCFAHQDHPGTLFHKVVTNRPSE